MLRLRVITALILAGGLVLTLAFASYPLQACIFALVATAGAWEWATLAGAHSNWYRGAFAAGIPLLCFVLWSGVGLPDMESAAAAQPFLAASAFLWSVMLLGLKYYPAGQTIWQLVIVRAFLGLWIWPGRDARTASRQSRPRHQLQRPSGSSRTPRKHHCS